jgi:hypothetical protein
MSELLSMKHRPLVETLIKKLGLPISEYNFSNLYLFRNAHQYSLEELSQNAFGLIGVSYSGHRYFMPFFSPDSWGDLVKKCSSYDVQYIYPVPESWWSHARAAGLHVEVSEDDTDYVYNVDEIATFRGRHFDGHRNAIRGLLSNHEIQVRDITQDHIGECHSILQGWSQHFAGSENNDTPACREGLDHFFQLHLQGWIFYADNKPIGFIIGEPLTADTFLLHFAKASSRFHGIYALMYQECAKAITGKFQFMNWEQDLGIEALRVAKHTYHPKHHIKKGRVIVCR